MALEPDYRMGIFAQWQPRYAEHGIATFPVRISPDSKVPATKHYHRVGLSGSAKLAEKFARADAFGFMCGGRSKITVLDMDSTDSAILIESERRFGPSPLVWHTGSGKFASAYRHNGEVRRIRPFPDLPIDLLGGGVAVAPPSVGTRQSYEIIRGSLEDLDRLPPIRVSDEMRRATRTDRIAKGKRNRSLFDHLRLNVVQHCDDLDQLIDAAMTWAEDNFALRMTPAEVRKTCESIWTYRAGRKRVMYRIMEGDQFRALVVNQSALALFAYLQAENGPDSTFMIANGLAQALGWPRRSIQDGRKLMLEQALIECVRPPRKGLPALYRWTRTS